MNYDYCLLSVMIGDYCGSGFEGHQGYVYDYELNDSSLLYKQENTISDDSICTMAIMSAIMSGTFDWENKLKKFGNFYYDAGYGSMFRQWLIGRINNYASWGNGSAMRCSPIAWYSKTIDECDKLTEESCKCTHNTEYAINGAKCLNRAIWYAKNGYSKDQIRELTIDLFFPDWKGLTFDDYKEHFINLGEDVDNFDWYLRCDHIVCMCILAFLVSDNFEHALYLAISQGYDTDTAGAIISPLAYAFFKEIPEKYISVITSGLSPEVLVLNETFSHNFIN